MAYTTRGRGKMAAINDVERPHKAPMAMRTLAQCISCKPKAADRGAFTSIWSYGTINVMMALTPM